MELEKLHEQRTSFLNEAKIIGKQFGIITKFPIKRRSKSTQSFDQLTAFTAQNENSSESDLQSYEESTFKRKVYDKLFDSVISGLNSRYKAAEEINNSFQFLWKYLVLTEDDLKCQANAFIHKYPSNVSKELLNEIFDLKSIHFSVAILAFLMLDLALFGPV